ncbi:hypothetical protein [Xinfangfangia pollutisoli]|uniref:hypothetical protein n=1 Tax=Xinfangfangia pollutisoli TaxID=2865960 RepID=UPI001CD6F54D|nr:hypothetical protein [Xinfangfangia pollutisoli]
MDLAVADPKGLVRESYRIEGITLGECRSIFIDWALSLKPGTDVPEALRALIAHYGAGVAGHPMTDVLEAGLVAPAETGRRGGRMARMRGLDGQA